MTREQITAWAREAKLPYYCITGEVVNLHKLERFAELVAAAERERCALLVEQAGIDGYGALCTAHIVRTRA